MLDRILVALLPIARRFALTCELAYGRVEPEKAFKECMERYYPVPCDDDEDDGWHFCRVHNTDNFECGCD